MTFSIHSSPHSIVERVEKANPDFKQYNEKTKRSNIIEGLWWQASQKSMFHGPEGTEGVIRDFRGSHEKSASLMASITKEIQTNNFVKDKFKFRNRLTVGSRVDISRYLSGDSRCWNSVRKTRSKAMTVRVFAPMGGLGNITRKELQTCGALSVSVTEAIESMGINVELWASCICGDILRVYENKGQSQEENKDAICTLIKIKDSEQYCDYGMIEYITGDSYFYMNIIFKDRYLSAMTRADDGLFLCGDGWSYNFKKEALQDDEDFISDFDIVVPRIYNIEAAKKWLEKDFLNDVESNINKINGGKEE
jgi:hypothetical protein